MSAVQKIDIDDKKKNNKKRNEMPTKSEIKEWFGHIISLKIKMFLIESNIPPLCQYCEAWKKNTLERKYLYRLHDLLGLREEQVRYEEVPCDWNCLHTIEYYDPKTKQMMEYPNELDERGENYFIAYGMDIEYFPAIYIRLVSTHYLNGKVPFETIFQGLGRIIKKEKRYSLFGNIYKVEKEVPDVSFLHQLIRFLRSLNSDNLAIPIHDKFSLFLGQYHRQGS